MLTRAQVVRGVQNFVLIFLSVGIVALYSSWRRPIWTDEATQFVWGANDVSLETIWRLLQDTQQLQHGQTGFYILLNNVSLNILGASSTVLRSPSILAGFFLCVLSAYFFRIGGFRFKWQLLAVFCVSSLSYLLYFAGEARAYMVLAACTVGTLCYYFARVVGGYRARSPLIAFVGWASVLLGVLNHPYFGLYWACICLLAFSWQCLIAKRQPSIVGLVKFSNSRLLVIGSALVLILGAFTWMRPNPRPDVNPFEFQSRENMVMIFFDAHFNFVWPYQFVMASFVAAVVGVTVLAVFPKLRNPLNLQLLMPISLIAVSSLLTIAISLASYFSNYWILSRQWVGSMALMPIAYVWFFALIARQFEFAKKAAFQVSILVLAAVPIAFAFTERVQTQVRRLAEYSAAFDAIEVPQGPITEEVQHNLWAELGWDAANINIKVGGPVWKVFKQ